MSNVPLNAASLRGAVDLSSLVKQHNTPAATSSAGEAATAASQSSGYASSANDASFTQVLELSNTVPVIVEFFGQGVEASLEPVIAQYKGRLALVTVDATSNPQLAQAFQVREVPTVAAVIGGRPVQLFSGILPASDLSNVLDQVLQLAAENNVTGTLPPSELEGEGAGEEAVEEPLPPLHQEAFDAISAGNFAAAITAYQSAIAQNPRDQEAIAGLAQVSLLSRLEGKTADEVRAAAANNMDSVDAQLAVADLDVSGGHLSDACDRLLQLYPSADSEGKSAIRTRLLDYFEIAGADDPRVVQARRRLTMLLY